MKINILKILCGSDQPLPTHSFAQLFFMACVFVFSSYAQADSLSGAVEKVAYSSSLGSVILLGLGLCSLLIVRRRKPWIAAVNETNLRHG
jgi:hypothetical protein